MLELENFNSFLDSFVNFDLRQENMFGVLELIDNEFKPVRITQSDFSKYKILDLNSMKDADDLIKKASELNNKYYSFWPLVVKI